MSLTFNQALLGSTPTGAIQAFSYATAPDGWLECDGAEVSRTEYSKLYEVIGDTYGSGDGSTTFNIPDLRGQFIRGWDNGRGVDTNRVLGSNQDSQNLAHSHTGIAQTAGSHTHGIPLSSRDNAGSRVPEAGGYETGRTASVPAAGAHTHNLSINQDGGSESRPKNVAMMYCIKT